MAMVLVLGHTPSPGGGDYDSDPDFSFMFIKGYSRYSGSLLAPIQVRLPVATLIILDEGANLGCDMVECRFD